MLSFSHGSIAIRGERVRCPRERDPPREGDAGCQQCRQHPDAAATADHPDARHGSEGQGDEQHDRPRPRREHDRASRPRQEDAGGRRSPARPHRAAEQEAGGDEAQAGGDRHVLEVDVGCPEPQRRRKDERPGERAGEGRAEDDCQCRRESGHGHDRDDQVGDPLVEVGVGIVGLQPGGRAAEHEVEHVGELLDQHAVELQRPRDCRVGPREGPGGVDRAHRKCRLSVLSRVPADAAMDE